MAHFARIDDNNVVVEVIVVEPDLIKTGILGDPSKWIQTSYNTRGGIHYKPNNDKYNVPSEDQSKALRKNYAVVGGTYDPVRDAFIAPKEFDSWILNEETCIWEAPIPWPDDGRYYRWAEKKQKWIVYPDSPGISDGPEKSYYWDEEQEMWILNT